MKIILFNGPPRSGKDTAAEHVFHYLQAKKITSFKYSFAQRLKESSHSLLGLYVAYDAFEHCKDTPQSRFMGLSPRQFYIKYSEQCIKPAFGKDFFGKCFVNFLENNILDTSDLTVIVSDCGFEEEVYPIVDAYGKDNVVVIQLERCGHDYSNDSRSYISYPGSKCFRVSNNESIEKFYEKIERIVDEVL